jgi:hypothetical protein
LAAWDDASARLNMAMTPEQLDAGLQSFFELRGDPSPADAFDTLCKILENPEAAKLVKFTSFHAAYYRYTKAILRHCAKLRRMAAKRQGTRNPLVQYTPLNEPWSTVRIGLANSGAWPGPAIHADSPEFYRIALEEVFWDRRAIPEDALRACVTSWAKPHEGAIAVLAAITGLSLSYVEKRAYTKPRKA